MAKIQKFSEIQPTLSFTEFDILKSYQQSFAQSELVRLHSVFPFAELARSMNLRPNQQKMLTYDHSGNSISIRNLEYHAQAISSMVDNSFFLYSGFDISHKLHRIRNGEEDSTYFFLF